MKQFLGSTLFFLALCSLAVAQGTPIPKHSKLFIEPNAGFEVYLIAAFDKKQVPVTVVMDKAKAEFILTSAVEHGKEPSWAQTWVLKKGQRNEDASLYILNAQTNSVCWAYAVHKYSAKHGEQSTAESVAKHLKEKIHSGK